MKDYTIYFDKERTSPGLGERKKSGLKPLAFNSAASLCGGSATGSSVRVNVPQCIPKEWGV